MNTKHFKRVTIARAQEVDFDDPTVIAAKERLMSGIIQLLVQFTILQNTKENSGGEN